MLAKSRLVAFSATALIVIPSLLAVLATPVAATGGRDSPAAAIDATTGPFLGLFDGSVFVASQPAPVVYDWYKMNVVEGQILQVALFMGTNGRITVYHPDQCSASGCTMEIANQGINTDGAHCGFGLATLDLIVQKTELVYFRVSPSNAAGSQYYNLAVRAYNASEITSGGSITPAASRDSIHGWAYSVTFIDGGGNCNIVVPELFVSDYYWVNVTDAVGPSHQNYRVTLSYTCATAMFDMYLSQLHDSKGARSTPLNHSLSSVRRDNRGGSSMGPISFDFAPVLYDGRYLLEVYAVENGSFHSDGSQPYGYTLSMSAVGGYARDDNDRSDRGAWVNTSQKVNGRIDGRDDSGDWFQIPALRNDSISIGVTLNRENNEIVTLAQRYRAMVFAPNGTLVRDAVNWYVQGNQLIFGQFISVQTFSATEDGIYTMLLLTADGALTTLNVARASGWVGRSWANYEVNFVLPNRPPVQLFPLPDMVLEEDTPGQIDLAPFFVDPEGRLSYPPFAVSNSVNFGFSFMGVTTLVVNPLMDFTGSESVNISVRDDFGHIVKVPFNITVNPVNDRPRIWSYADANWSTVNLAEDTETTVYLWGIFNDIDDLDLTFTPGGVSGGHMDVEVADSGFVTITPFPNWNGCQQITWTATDAGFLTANYVSNVCVSAVNDPPKATDRRLDRIQFNEGSEYAINLSGEFFDLDGDPLRYYGVIDDPLVAQYVRINNSLLTPFDPNMRVFVLDSARSSYFTDGPVQVRFFVKDALDNYDPTQGITLDVEKTTFLEILNVNDPPILDDFTPDPGEVNLTQWHEGDTITFSVTSVKDSDKESQFFFKWFVNGEEVPQEVSPTFVFKTVLDRTRPGQYDANSYTVSVQVFDAAGAKAIREPVWEFSVAKTNRQPTLTILRPTLPTFEEGGFIDFAALSSDEDPEDAGHLRITWSYVDADGKTQPLGNGTGDKVRAMLDPGTYRVQVSAFDGIEYQNRTITITVNEHQLNTPGFEVAGAALAVLVAAFASGGVAARRRKR